MRDGEEAVVEQALSTPPTISLAYDPALDGITPDHHGPQGLDRLIEHLGELQA